VLEEVFNSVCGVNKIATSGKIFI